MNTLKSVGYQDLLKERLKKKKKKGNQSAKHPVYVWVWLWVLSFKWLLVLHLLKWDWRDAGMPTCVQKAQECYTWSCPALRKHTHTHTRPDVSFPSFLMSDSSPAQKTNVFHFSVTGLKNTRLKISVNTKQHTHTHTHTHIRLIFKWCQHNHK